MKRKIDVVGALSAVVDTEIVRRQKFQEKKKKRKNKRKQKFDEIVDAFKPLEKLEGLVVDGKKLSFVVTVDKKKLDVSLGYKKNNEEFRLYAPRFVVHQDKDTFQVFLGPQHDYAWRVIDDYDVGDQYHENKHLERPELIVNYGIGYFSSIVRSKCFKAKKLKPLTCKR